MSLPASITDKELNLLKGAIRRVFARSEIHRLALDMAEVKHSDPAHPRVTRWSLCASCKKPFPRYKAKVDHIDPIVPVTTSYLDMVRREGLDGLAIRLWCAISGLQILDPACHHEKSKQENKLRPKKPRKSKKGKVHE